MMQLGTAPRSVKAASTAAAGGSRAPLLPGRRCAPAPRFQQQRTSLSVLRFKEDDKVDDITRKQDATGSARDLLKQTPQSVSDVQRVMGAAAEGGRVQPGPSNIRVPFWMPAFTRRREVFMGRAAMVGFFATCIWEIIMPQHPGPLNQVVLLTGLPPYFVASLLVGIVSYNMSALLPWGPTFAPQNLMDLMRRPEGPPLQFFDPIVNFKKVLGISGLGFTKRNEVFNGRLAMLGFGLAVITEIQKQHGPLAEVATWFGLVPNQAFYALVAPQALLLFVSTTLALSAIFPSHLEGRLNKEDDIY